METRDDPDAPAGTPAEVDGILKQTRQPQFISSAYFLRFKFEEGKYALVGREKLDGIDTLKIEYYPDANCSPAATGAARAATRKPIRRATRPFAR